MQPEKMENLAHQLVEVRNNLELQTTSIDMLSTLNNPRNIEDPFYGKFFTEKLTSTLYDNLQNLSSRLDDIAFELYQASESIKVSDQIEKIRA